VLRINVRAPLVRRSFAEPGRHLSAKFPGPVLRYPLLHKRAHASHKAKLTKVAAADVTLGRVQHLPTSGRKLSHLGTRPRVGGCMVR
jgi:hypothetical protein